MKTDEQIAIDRYRDCITKCADFFSKIRDRITEEDELFNAADEAVTSVISDAVAPTGIRSGPPEVIGGIELTFLKYAAQETVYAQDAAADCRYCFAHNALVKREVWLKAALEVQVGKVKS